MKFIVIEGIDACGKSTQINLLQQYLKKNKIKYKYLHFPRTDSPIYGELIAMFLRGDLGDINNVNPYLVALLYAGDRNNAKKIISGWLKNNYLVIADRYVYSNIAFQCAKFDNQDKKNKLKQWIKYLEFEYNKIPVPDFSLFLDVPFEFTIKKLTKERSGEDRDYLKGQKDIHEQSMEFQTKVRSEYLTLINEDAHFHLINCRLNNKSILPAEKISEKIISICFQKKI